MSDIIHGHCTITGHLFVLNLGHTFPSSTTMLCMSLTSLWWLTWRTANVHRCFRQTHCFHHQSSWISQCKAYLSSLMKQEAHISGTTHYMASWLPFHYLSQSDKEYQLCSQIKIYFLIIRVLRTMTVVHLMGVLTNIFFTRIQRYPWCIQLKMVAKVGNHWETNLPLQCILTSVTVFT